MAFELPALPYEKDALAPHMSKETLEFHHGKHHNTYVVKLNGLVEGTELTNQSLEELIQTQSGGIFNNAAQIWNHTFFWHCLAPNAGGPATGALASAIDAKFGSFEAFQTAFTDAAINNFGAGWTWLVKNAQGELEIFNTSNAGCPLTEGLTPILTVDVWEHAYYIDYRNVRPDFLKAFWALVNWDFANQNFAA